MSIYTNPVSRDGFDEKPIYSVIPPADAEIISSYDLRWAWSPIHTKP